MISVQATDPPDPQVQVLQPSVDGNLFPILYVLPLYTQNSKQLVKLHMTPVDVHEHLLQPSVAGKLSPTL